jgi:hypothetical protein
MAADEVGEGRVCRDFAARSRTQPRRAPVDHGMRNDRARPPYRLHEGNAERTHAVDDRDLVRLKRDGLVALAELTAAVQMQGDDVIVLGHARDLLARAHEFVAGAIERGKT